MIFIIYLARIVEMKDFIYQRKLSVMLLQNLAISNNVYESHTTSIKLFVIIPKHKIKCLAE